MENNVINSVEYSLLDFYNIIINDNIHGIYYIDYKYYMCYINNGFNFYFTKVPSYCSLSEKSNKKILSKEQMIKTINIFLRKDKIRKIIK